jgi:hypothetical protein
LLVQSIAAQLNQILRVEFQDYCRIGKLYAVGRHHRKRARLHADKSCNHDRSLQSDFRVGNYECLKDDSRRNNYDAPELIAVELELDEMNN